MKLKILAIVFILFSFCSKKANCDDREIIHLIESNDVHKIIMGNYLIGECKKEKLISYLFKDIRDPRVSHKYQFYGISVYQSKIIALKKYLV